MHAPPAIACDCLIVGGGPAGAALAALLAADGVRTVLVDDGRAHHSGPCETLLPASSAALASARCLELVQAAAIADPLRHGSIWGTGELRWQEPSSGGLLLQRGAFDDALRRMAAARGADVRCPARVDSDLAAATAVGVAVATAAGPVRFHPKVVVVATGRRPLRGLLENERTAGGPPTHAVTLVGMAGPGDRGVAVVEAVEDGWLWFLGRPDGRASVACLLDPPAPGLRAVDRLARMLAASTGPAHRLRRWAVMHGNAATPHRVQVAADVLLIGDAAATIDPLASQGVEKAIAAGDHAAAVVRSMLGAGVGAVLRARLRDQHRRWEHGLHHAHCQRAAAFYAAETRFPQAPFWRRRQDSAVTAVEPEVPLDAALQLARTVTFGDALRRAGDGFETCPGAFRGDDVLTHLGFVPVVPLLEQFRAPCTLAQALAGAGRDARCFVLPPAAVLLALRELAQRGWLVSARCAPAAR